VVGCPFSPTVGEKMMGRLKNGTPLAWRPNVPPELDAFRYRMNDAEGFQCPRGSHIRRSNPRDSLGVDVPAGVRSSKLHRLLRRGRSYIDNNHPGDGASPEQGMLFIACNADLDRQFEFIQQRWIANPRFGDQFEELDPILGVRPDPDRGPPANKRFSMPGLPIGTAVQGLPNFTLTMGAGYFFLPSLSALKFIVAMEEEKEKEEVAQAGFERQESRYVQAAGGLESLVPG
jgi:porphyrinogen peroxidase